MDNLLSMDPGKRVLCWAAWDGVDHRGRLVDIDLSLVDEKLPLGALALRHAANVPHGADVVALEEMGAPYVRQKTTPQKEKRTAADLLLLQAIGGVVAGRAVRAGGLIQYVRVNDWKGSMKKEHTRHWITKALNEAGPEELRILERACKRYPAALRHNLWDGAGVGLSYLGRLRIR